MKRYLILAFSVLCLLILTACGEGGGGGGNTGGGTVGNENVGDGNGGGNSAPVANAGPNQNVLTGSLVTLDGSVSSDADNDLITYRWSFVSVPIGSTTMLSDNIAVNPTFTADVAGSYVLSLVVNDGTSDSSVDSVTVTVSTTPVANAGVNQNVSTGSLVTLDGSSSYDPDGDLITYAWSFVSMPIGSTAALSDSTVVNPSFTADMTGSYVLSLVVNDGTSDSSANAVTVAVSTTPVANAGGNQNIATGSLVTLDGSSSYDPDGDLITYSWSFVSVPTGSSAALSDTTVVNPSFTADMTGSYVLSLVVNDSTSDSSAGTVTVAVSTTPVANAGANQNVVTGSLATLDGSGSYDPDGDLITYTWSFVSMPTGSIATLSDETIVNPSLAADIAGSYVLSLVVNDGTSDSAADTVTVAVSTTPVANAGPDQNVANGSLVTLDGSSSYDPDSDPLIYSWSFVSVPTGSTAALSDTAIVNPTFTSDVNGSYVISLVVNDGTSDSTADTVTITVSTAPVGNAGPDQNVATGSLVTLDGSGSYDPDGDPLTYSWSFVSVPTGAMGNLSDSTVANPTFTADGIGSYVLRLVVNDGTVNSAADTVTVSTPVPVLLASTINPREIAVDSTYVYWTMPDAVMRIAINGGTATTFAITNSPYGIAVDATSVYWTDIMDGTINKKAKFGRTVRTIASGLTEPSSIAVDSTSVYFTEGWDSGNIKKVGIDGGTVTTLASGQYRPSDIAVDSTSVYFTEYAVNGNIKKVGINRSAVTTLASGLSGPWRIAVDSTIVYFTEGCCISKVGINGGTVTRLAESLGSEQRDLAVDSTNVYFNDYTWGYIKRVEIDGGTITTIGDTTRPVSIAMDSTNVYWLDSNPGKVWKVAK